MSDTALTTGVSKHGRPAVVVRLIGWGMLGLLGGFLIENVLMVGFGYSGASGFLFGGDTGALASFAAYVVCVLLAVAHVMRGSDTALRYEARQIHNFNIFIIRFCFWAVLLIGIADGAIAILRVEKGLSFFFNDDIVRSFGLSRFVGMYVHIPLMIVSVVLAAFTRTLGFTWLALMIVFAELLIVITRFVFSYEQALMGDLVRYWYAALFLFASAYTLFDEGHVRVDVLYAGFKDTTRGFVNAFGAIFLGASTCWVILGIGLNGKQSIINAPVMNFEITQTGGVGMFVKYQMAAFLAIFAITMLIQFIGYFFEAVADYREEPGHLEHEEMLS